MGKKKQVINQNTTIKPYYNTKNQEEYLLPEQEPSQKTRATLAPPLSTPLDSIRKSAEIL
jgi:hypothetical protein